MAAEDRWARVASSMRAHFEPDNNFQKPVRAITPKTAVRCGGSRVVAASASNFAFFGFELDLFRPSRFWFRGQRSSGPSCTAEWQRLLRPLLNIPNHSKLQIVAWANVSPGGLKQANRSWIPRRRGRTCRRRLGSTLRMRRAPCSDPRPRARCAICHEIS